MVRIILYPFIAQIIANPIPVFPLVGSMIIVSGVILPEFSASTIICSAALSFTEFAGLKYSSLIAISAYPELSLFSLTSGVLPTSSVKSFAIFIKNSFFIFCTLYNKLYIFNIYLV